MEEQVGLNQKTQPPNSELESTGRPRRRALLNLDGHSSRNNLSLMSWLYENEIDVILLPSHTSGYLQPLDHVPNKKSKTDNAGMDRFLNRRFDAAQEAMHPTSIRARFHKAGLIVTSPTKMLKNLRDEDMENAAGSTDESIQAMKTDTTQESAARGHFRCRGTFLQTHTLGHAGKLTKTGSWWSVGPDGEEKKREKGSDAPRKVVRRDLFNTRSEDYTDPYFSDTDVSDNIVQLDGSDSYSSLSDGEIARVLSTPKGHVISLVDDSED
ncbi:hypothetical protein BLNAU_15661 [Blattamonas nauphoetae]|uniref:DDE-1 domain-containing protein n=1 Tax=Blattamonas nauphoetae TaxID=2049346 RepID=A0ABQ9XDR9_9EUKA|nr:hypothetical protein BLNAU_15661 [Blattamonas nauphoetae]